VNEQLHFEGIDPPAPAPSGDPAVGPSARDQRIARRKQNYARWDSLRARRDDMVRQEEAEMYGEYDSGEDSLIVPDEQDTWGGLVVRRRTIGEVTSGDFAPSGEVDTNQFYPNIAGNPVPAPFRFQGAPESSWRRWGTYREVPLQDVRTLQSTVSASRLREILDNPDARSSPRLPYVERPHAYVAGPSFDTDGRDRYIITDGNHRAMAHAVRNEMFLPVQAAGGITTQNRFEDDAARVSRAKRSRNENPYQNPDWKERLNERYYGSGY
jgi:hypothetical protein